MFFFVIVISPVLHAVTLILLEVQVGEAWDPANKAALSHYFVFRRLIQKPF
jgi:hypothetical protein